MIEPGQWVDPPVLGKVTARRVMVEARRMPNGPREISTFRVEALMLILSPNPYLSYFPQFATSPAAEMTGPEIPSSCLGSPAAF